MRYGFLATRYLNVCAKFQVSTSKTVAATLRTYIYRTYIHTYIHTDRQVKQEKPGANQVRRGAPYRLVYSTGLWNSTGFPLNVSIIYSTVIKYFFFQIENK